MIESDSDLSNEPHNEKIAIVLIVGIFISSLLSLLFLMISYKNEENKSWKRTIAIWFNILFLIFCLFLGFIICYDLFLRDDI